MARERSRGIRVKFRLSGEGRQGALPALYLAGHLLGGGLALWLFASGAGLFAAGVALILVSGLVGGCAHRVNARHLGALARVREALRQLARGRLPEPLGTRDLGELADTGEALNRVVRLLLGVRERMGGVASRLVEVPQRIDDALTVVQRSAFDQEAAVEETAALHATMATSSRRISLDVEDLARANEESAAVILELGSAVEQIASSATTLQEKMESSTSSLHQVGDNIKLVALNSDSVQQGAEETAASVTEMDRAIQEVGVHVRGASDLADRLSEDAKTGSQAVGATIDGIAAIREATLTARGALEGLADRIEEIGQIATVIGAVTDETNLLSLNAAIIAAQAGEHGKPFAVVAGQVKTLARRTAQSTKEIEDLIAAVQEQSHRAVRAMAAGSEAVEQGVLRSRLAGDALGAIRGTADEASGRVGEIARAAEEQARNSKQVAEAACRTSEHVQEISRALAEQSESTERLLENVTTAVLMCRQMATATVEQGKSAQYITGNIESIVERIRDIQVSALEQERSAAAAAETVTALLDHAREGAQRVPALSEGLSALREEAELLGRELARQGAPDQPDPDSD